VSWRLTQMGENLKNMGSSDTYNFLVRTVATISKQKSYLSHQFSAHSGIVQHNWLITNSFQFNSESPPPIKLYFMQSYKSIKTVFTRDKDTNKLNFGENRTAENLCIKNWVIQEKVDGTNIRIIISNNGVEVRGRTDKAELKQDLVLHCKSLITAEVIDKIKNYFNITQEEWTVTLYGEGYGAGIQTGGIYRRDKAFICFDILRGDSQWLNPFDVTSLCTNLNIETVPLLALVETIPQSKEELLDLLPYSFVARQHTGKEVMGEGIVARPLEILFDKWGNRIMWKLTFREF
jgi:hypothetical protein